MRFNKNNMFKGTKLSYLYQTTGPYEYKCSLSKYE
jgi:plastocyanin